MQTNSATSTGNTGGIDPAAIQALAGGNQVTKDMFLQLLVQQLKNQNPLDPIKDTEFVSQLATFSSLEQLAGMNATLLQIQAILAKQQPAPTTTNQST